MNSKKPTYQDIKIPEKPSNISRLEKVASVASVSLLAVLLSIGENPKDAQAGQVPNKKFKTTVDSTGADSTETEVRPDTLINVPEGRGWKNLMVKPGPQEEQRLFSIISLNLYKALSLAEINNDSSFLATLDKLEGFEIKNVKLKFIGTVGKVGRIGITQDSIDTNMQEAKNKVLKSLGINPSLLKEEFVYPRQRSRAIVTNSGPAIYRPPFTLGTMAWDEYTHIFYLTDIPKIHIINDDVVCEFEFALSEEHSDNTIENLVEFLKYIKEKE